MFGYRVPQADQAMLISGGRSAGPAPFRVVTGHGAFIMPFFRKAQFLTLAMFEAEVEEPCVTQQGIALSVRAVIAAKVGNDAESIVNAAQRFLSDQSQMSMLTGRIFAGHLRSIIGSMTVEEIITERQKLASEVLDGSKGEMARMGLIVDALQIQNIDDGGLGYIKAMAAPHNARIQQQAQIAQASATRAAAEAQQASLRAQAQYERDTAITRAGFAAETQSAEAKGPPRRGRWPRLRRSRRSSMPRPISPSGRPGCVSSSWSPRSSSLPRRRPSGCASWRRPMPRRCRSRPLPPPRATVSRSTRRSSTSCR